MTESKQPDASGVQGIDDNGVQVIEPDNRLARKAASPTKADRDALVAGAERNIERLRPHFEQNLRNDLENLRRRIAEFDAEATDTPEALEAIYSVLHEIRGQAGSYGHEALSRVANRTCRFMERADIRNDKFQPMLLNYASTLEHLFQQGATSDGARAAETLVASLADAEMALGVDVMAEDNISNFSLLRE